LLREACDPMRWSLVPPLRTWLTRALSLGPKPFTTAAEAVESLDELLPRVSGMWAARLLPQNVSSPTSGAPAPTVPTPPGVERERSIAPPLGGPDEREVTAASSRSIAAQAAERESPHATSFEVRPASPSTLDTSVGTPTSPAAAPLSATAASTPDTIALAAVASSDRRLWLVCLGLTAIALLEALCLLILLLKQ
jgi:hypothetical protein